MIEFPGQKFSPSADRNKDAIAEVILPYLPAKAQILEIASGTGQHAYHMTSARPDIRWQMSDQDPQYLDGLQTLKSPGLIAPVRIDVTQPDWWAALQQYDAVYCANMIHIAPQAALPGLARGVAPLLSPDGCVFLYGPFLDADRSAVSNLEFDRSLKARNPQWGVKDLRAVKHIFALNGLALAKVLEMPRDNSLLIFKQS